MDTAKQLSFEERYRLQLKEQHQLSPGQRDQLEMLIDDSIRQQYDGPLFRDGEDQHGEVHYTPEDTDHVRDLLTALWGEVLTTQAIEDAFERLLEWGEWPHGYCEEDEDEEFSISSLGPD